MGFQQQNRQNLNNDTSYRPTVTSTQCIIGTQNCPDSGILLNYDDNDYSQSYGQIKEGFRALTKDDILQPNISDHDFRSSYNKNDIGYNLYVFHIGYQENWEAALPIRKKFKYPASIPAGLYGYALMLTNKLVTISSEGQRHFDLIKVIFKIFMTLLFPFIDNSVFSSDVLF